MTNEQRRLALAKARVKALEHAIAAESAAAAANWGDFEVQTKLAEAWSSVAGAMKVGQNIQADGMGPEPPDDEPFVNRPAYTTR